MAAERGLKQNGKRSGMSEDSPTGYTETSEERERLLMLYEPDVRAVIEAFMTEHGVTAREAINATVPFWLDRPRG